MSFRHAIVIGGSSGIGRSLAIQLSQSQCKVLIIGRDKSRLEEVRSSAPEKIEVVAMDVRDLCDKKQLLSDLALQLGGLDLVIYAAGVMPAVQIDEFDFEKDKEMIDINFRAAVDWLDAAAVRFQGVRAGTIVGIGSVAGVRGRRGQPAYNASKAALHAYLEALRNRLSAQGVVIATAMPGPVDTPMTKNLPIKGKMSSDEAARIILKRSSKSGEFFLKPAHAIAFTIFRFIPSFVFRRLPI